MARSIAPPTAGMASGAPMPSSPDRRWRKPGGAKHADIEVPAAHHGEGVAVVKVAAAVEQSHSFRR